LERTVVSRKIAGEELEAKVYRNIIVAIDVIEENSWHAPLICAVELARKFAAQLHVVTVVRDLDALLQASVAPIGYEVIVTEVENQLAGLIRRATADDLHPSVQVVHGASIYAEILRIADEVKADLIVVGSHRPEMKDYLLGTNSSRVARHAGCSVLIARE
jgi:nucleotide-binding universal stress UspA family protein